MAIDGQWGDGITLQAMSNVLGVKIRIVNSPPVQPEVRAEAMRHVFKSAHTIVQETLLKNVNQRYQIWWTHSTQLSLLFDPDTCQADSSSDFDNTPDLFPSSSNDTGYVLIQGHFLRRNTHVHPAEPETAFKITAEPCWTEFLVGHMGDQDALYPIGNPANLTRMVNRHRQKLQIGDPTDMSHWLYVSQAGEVVVFFRNALKLDLGELFRFHQIQVLTSIIHAVDDLEIESADQLTDKTTVLDAMYMMGEA
ncbi:hypothetical protein Bbelb_019400 [Branchiostoma belcheri]|nr:hypothetical protein Bbelb_019400 [Branchiostoma belcheri]